MGFLLRTNIRISRLESKILCRLVKQARKNIIQENREMKLLRIRFKNL